MTLEYLDASGPPGKDFFRYTNGGWLRTATIPPDRRMAGINLELDRGKRRIVLSNPHSPSAYRVNGVLRNEEGWYAAFPQVRAGDAYYLPPEERVALW